MYTYNYFHIENQSSQCLDEVFRNEKQKRNRRNSLQAGFYLLMNRNLWNKKNK
jgi:hypothetical protein